MTVRKLFLEVDDAVSVAVDVEHGLFVPTRLPLQLGDHLILGLRLPHTKRAIELPVVVVGRRPPKSGSLLSAGVLVRLSDLQHPLVEVLREVASGRVIDLEARLQERLRYPARIDFRDRVEANHELLGLLGEDGAVLPINQSFVHGDRLLLDVVIGGRVVFSVAVLVRRLQTNDNQLSVIITALDEPARAIVGAFLNDEAVDSNRSRA